MAKGNVVFFIFLIFFSYTSCHFAEKENDSDNKIIDYLKNNSLIYNKNIEESSKIEILNKDILNSRIILSGELHHYDKNNDFIIDFYKYLNQRYDVKYYLLEYSYAYIQLFNEYLKTGDMSYILKNHRIRFKEEKEFLENFYNLNQSLPDSKKIRMIGIDVESDFVNSIIYFSILLKNKNYETEQNLSSLIELYNQIEGKYRIDVGHDATYQKYEKVFYAIIDSINENNKKNSEYFKEIFDSDYNDFFECIRKNIESHSFFNELKKSGYGKYSFDKNSLSKRDFYIYESIVQLLKRYPKEKFYGNFGQYHTFQLKGTINFINFVQLLNNSKTYKGKILSLPIIYKNIDGQYNEQRFLKDQYADLFYNLAYSEFSIFKLNSGKSPFTKKGKNILFYYPKNLIPKISTVDNFQYVIVVNGVKKMKLLEE